VVEWSVGLRGWSMRVRGEVFGEGARWLFDDDGLGFRISGRSLSAGTKEGAGVAVGMRLGIL
jgi:hypothetical protein